MHDQARDQSDRLIDAINRLAAAVEQLDCSHDQLGEVLPGRYTRVQDEFDLVSEGEMAARLGLNPRALAKHRRSGKLPGCWVKNGRRVLYHVEQTHAAWKRGLS